MSESVASDSESASVNDVWLLPPNHLAPSPDRRRVRGDTDGARERERDGDLDGVRSVAMAAEGGGGDEGWRRRRWWWVRRARAWADRLVPSQCAPAQDPDGAS